MNLSQKIEHALKSLPEDKFLLGDHVVITTGRSKGQHGILKKKIRTRTGLRYLIEHCHLVFKHLRANPQNETAGTKKKIEASVHASNVAIFNPETLKADKVRFVVEDGKKVRHYKSTGVAIEKKVFDKKAKTQAGEKQWHG